MTLPDGREVSRHEDGELTPEQSRRLESAFNEVFIDGSNNYYNAYAQAWRLLGLYIDCNALQEDQDHYRSDGCQRYLLWAAVSN
jgi:hypothetical protein